MSSPQTKQNKRREMDVMKLLMSDWTVELPSESTKEFLVEFPGPKESPYEGGHWVVRVELPDDYPYKSPSIGFTNRIYHPNVDEGAGSVCLDVINQAWSPLFDLINVFEVFLPQLLLYPNPNDPLNGEAAALMLKDHEAYKKKIRDYVQKYARGGAAAKCSAPMPKQKRHVTKQAQPDPPRTASVHAGSPAPDSLMQSMGPLDTNASPSKPPHSDEEEEDELLGLLSDSEDEA